MKKYFSIGAITLLSILLCCKVNGYDASQETPMKITEFSLILKPTSNGGIGIFATHDIPAGTEVFSKMYNLRTMNPKHIPDELKKLCVLISDEECLCPERFDRMEIAWYVNHSDHPNIKRIEPRGCQAICDIKAGQEIVMDFNEFDEPEHLKECY